jgi:hypothetical protein
VVAPFDSVLLAACVCLFSPAVRAGGVAVLQSEPGADISTVLGLEFNEAVTGATCTVTTGALGTCPDCKVEYVIMFVCQFHNGTSTWWLQRQQTVHGAAAVNFVCYRRSKGDAFATSGSSLGGGPSLARDGKGYRPSGSAGWARCLEAAYVTISHDLT